MTELAHREMIAFLLKQMGAKKAEVAERMGTSPARISRMVRGEADATREELVNAAPLLALGVREPHEHPLPRWIVTRWWASGMIEPPPLTREQRLPVFANYDEAAIVAGYLRLFPASRTAVAVPVYPAWLRAQLDERGLAPDTLLPYDALGDDEALDELLSSIRRGFARERSPVDTAGHRR
jgi:transcriptional regulator with XRE-family HTH domain